MLEGVICLEDNYRGLSFVENRRAALGLNTFQADARAQLSEKHQGNGDAASPSIQAEDDGQDSDKHKNEYITGFRLSMITITANLSTLIAALDLGIVATAIPVFTDDFHSLQDIRWYSSGVFLTITATSALWRKMFTYIPVPVVYITALGFVLIFSTIIGPLIGGVFTTEVTWRWCFWVNLPIGGAAIILQFIFLRVRRKPEHATWTQVFLHLDLLGFALFPSSVVCFSLTLQWGGLTKAWSDGSVVATLISNFQFMFYLSLYFQSIQGTSAIKSGVYNLAIVAFFAVGLTFRSIVSGGVVRKTRLLQPVELAGALFATLCAGLLYGLSPNSSKAWYIGAHIRLGFGIGLANQVPITALQSFAKPEDLGFTMGIAFIYSGADVHAILDAYMGGIKDVYTFSLASRSSFRCAVVLRHPIQKAGEL
ncbi:putative Major facilitator superfamily transporter gliotoxin efflux transporter [Seiridium unicorne]|uniref:Major facilitator superfamily transporter gliotoxin efflux transporter n=1 Tax=Seiridium unicorne TaxID=138068 RepID=A0ABR2UTL1_9PEZI